jgi:hypothetical protein
MEMVLAQVYNLQLINYDSVNFEGSIMKTLLIVAGLTLSAVAAYAGGDSSGGGGPKTVKMGAIKLLLENDSLKKALLNYLSTVKKDQIEDEKVKATFGRITANNALSTDISTPHNYNYATPKQPCLDAFGKKARSSTIMGKIGAAICFDIEDLAEDYKDFSSDEVMIQLAALVLHEHVHHFQRKTNVVAEIQKNESEANHLAGYLLVTAKFVNLPLLEWTRPLAMECPNFVGKYKCVQDTNPDMIWENEIRQSIKDGVTTYTFVELQPDGSEYLDVLIADGQLRSDSKFSRIQASCTGDKMSYSRTYREGGSHKVNMVMQETVISNAKSLKSSTEYNDPYDGKDHFYYESEICTLVK